MKQSFRHADFDRLAAFWNQFAPNRYAIDAELLKLKTVDSPVFDWGASAIEDADGEILAFAAVKKPASQLYKGPDQDVAHLSLMAFADPSFGIDILSSVKQNLRNRGFVKLMFGQDSDHFFPGCPSDFPSLTSILMVEGFANGGEIVDLERDLSDYQNPAQDPSDAEFTCLDPKDHDVLVDFLNREFPGRWKYDTLYKIRFEGPSCVFALFIGGRMEGFALLQSADHRSPIGGGVWRSSLGESWGALGPIGVSAGIRGKGYGNALLGNALSELKARGVKNAIIDWTDLVDFYGKHGFKPTRTYRAMSLNL